MKQVKAIITKDRSEGYILNLLKNTSFNSKYSIKLHENKLYPDDIIEFRHYGVHYTIEPLKDGGVILTYYNAKNPSFHTPGIQTWEEATTFKSKDEALSVVAHKLATSDTWKWAEVYPDDMMHSPIAEVLF